jgi:hypothetical protein
MKLSEMDERMSQMRRDLNDPESKRDYLHQLIRAGQLAEGSEFIFEQLTEYLGLKKAPDQSSIHQEAFMGLWPGKGHRVAVFWSGRRLRILIHPKNSEVTRTQPWGTPVASVTTRSTKGDPREFRVSAYGKRGGSITYDNPESFFKEIHRIANEYYEIYSEVRRREQTQGWFDNTEPAQPEE